MAEQPNPQIPAPKLEKSGTVEMPHAPQRPSRTSRVITALLLLCVLQFLALVYFWREKQMSPAAPEESPAWQRVIRAPTAKAAPQETFFQGQPGPWGDVEYLRINIVSPDDLLPVDPKRFPPTTWHFSGVTAEQLSAFIQSCDLTPAQRTEMLNQKAWSITNNLITITPSEQLILGLAPTARSRIYGVLAESPDNDFQTWPFTYQRHGFNEWFDNSHVSPATLKLLRSLMYERGESLCFSDLPEALANIPLPAERRIVARTLMSRSGLLMNLRVHPDSDITALTDYWSRGGRAKDVSALLESLTRVPGGAGIDIAHLLPAFARARLDTFPKPPALPGPEPDCYWTAMNFFKSVPSPCYESDEDWRNDLAKNYAPVSSPTLGDVIFLLRPDNVPYHAAVYIADDVVFTKNGGNYRQPWLLMKMADMLGRYPTSFPPQIAFYRQKERAD
jgi:hypothetical protein